MDLSFFLHLWVVFTHFFVSLLWDFLAKKWPPVGGLKKPVCDLTLTSHFSGACFLKFKKIPQNPCHTLCFRGVFTFLRFALKHRVWLGFWGDLHDVQNCTRMRQKPQNPRRFSQNRRFWPTGGPFLRFLRVFGLSFEFLGFFKKIAPQGKFSEFPRGGRVSKPPKTPYRVIQGEFLNF